MIAGSIHKSMLEPVGPGRHLHLLEPSHMARVRTLPLAGDIEHDNETARASGAAYPSIVQRAVGQIGILRRFRGHARPLPPSLTGQRTPATQCDRDIQGHPHQLRAFPHEVAGCSSAGPPRLRQRRLCSTTELIPRSCRFRSSARGAPSPALSSAGRPGSETPG